VVSARNSRPGLRISAPRCASKPPAAWECSSRADLADGAEALELARRAVELDPDDEEGVRRLIAVLDRYGDRAGALRLYTEWRARLQAEYGAEPAPETRKLVRKVQAHRKGESAETPASLKTLTPPSETLRESASPAEPRREPCACAAQAPPAARGRSGAVVLLVVVGGSHPRAADVAPTPRRGRRVLWSPSFR
jgi:hypothetical protein